MSIRSIAVLLVESSVRSTALLPYKQGVVGFISVWCLAFPEDRKIRPVHSLLPCRSSSSCWCQFIPCVPKFSVHIKVDGKPILLCAVAIFGVRPWCLRLHSGPMLRSGAFGRAPWRSSGSFVYHAGQRFCADTFGPFP